jgi:hypothetical protein
MYPAGGTTAAEEEEEEDDGGSGFEFALGWWCAWRWCDVDVVNAGDVAPW